MNDPISTSILLTMVLIIVICALITTVLAVVGVRYLGTIMDTQSVGATKTATTGTPEDYRPDGIRRVSEKPAGMKKEECDHGAVHVPHVWRPLPPRMGTYHQVAGKFVREEPPTPALVWCPGLSQEQSDEADRLVKREAEMFHPDYVPPFGLREGTMAAERAPENKVTANRVHGASHLIAPTVSHPEEVPCSRVDTHAPHGGKITHTDSSTSLVRCPGRA